VIEGSQNLTFTDGNVGTTSVNAATSGNVFTGTLNFTAATNDANVLTLTGGSGNNDVFNLSNAIGALNLDVINGGSGTGETLAVKDAQATTITAADANITNIEALTLTTLWTGTVNAQWFGTMDTTLNLAAGTVTGAAAVVNFATSSAAAPDTLNLSNTSDGGFGFTANVGTSLTTSDVLNVIAGATVGVTSTGVDYFGAVHINGAETVNLSSGASAVVTNIFDFGFTLTPTVGAGTLTLSGIDNFDFADATHQGLVTAGVINASGLTGGAWVDIGVFNDTATASPTAWTIISGTGLTTTQITGSASGVDVIVGGGGTTPDFITLGNGVGVEVANQGTGTTLVTEGDTIVLGTGLTTQVGLIGDAALAASPPTAAYALVPHVTNFIVGASAAASDQIVLGKSDYSAVIDNPAGNISAGDAPVVQNVAQNAAATAGITGENILKLTTGVAAASSVQSTFNAAMGTATVTGEQASGQYIALFNDTTNNKMVIVDVAATAGGVIQSGDVVHLIGTVDITAANYANISANHFGHFVA